MNFSKLPYSGILILLLFSLLFTACEQLQTPAIPDEKSPVQTESTPEPAQNDGQGELLTFENSEFFSYSPFTLLYDGEQWQLDDQLEGLNSTEIDKCQFRILLGRGAGNTDGPFYLTVGENDFSYLIELPIDQNPSSTTTYFIYLEPDKPEFQRDDLMWAFEMVTTVEQEKACFQAIQPLLETLTISLPDNGN